MFIIRTIPLIKGGHLDALTYFSKVAYPVGTLLTVPVRNQHVRALVTSSDPVPTAKTMLRNMTFSLKKLPEQSDTRALSDATRAVAERLATYYACPLADILIALLPAAIREGTRALPYTPARSLNSDTSVVPSTDIKVLQAPSEERVRIYRTLVREAFARGGSVVVLAPTSTEALALSERLRGGIEDRTIVMHAHLSAKQTRDADEQLQNFTTPKLIVTYPGYALVERHDVITYIVDHERSHHYISRTRPHLDWRLALTYYAEQQQWSLILGDLFPSVETEHARREEKYTTIDETPRRLVLPGTLKIVERQHASTTAEPFELFSKRVLSAIEKTVSEKGRVFLFAARRGLAPVVTCVDCGFVFRSPESGAPYSLVRTYAKDGEEQRWFVDGVSGARTRAASNCNACGSWRIRERGIGIQHVYDELSKKIETPIILFDHLTANTPKKARYLSERFQTGAGVIMLGTSMALPYIGNDVSLSIIVNTDALRATPTWRAQEDMLATILTLRECTRGNVFAQTQHAAKKENLAIPNATEDVEPDDILEIARTGATEQFYTEEIVARKQFGYPPFTRFILLTYTGSAEDITQHDAIVNERLASWKPFLYNGTPREHMAVRHALLRLPLNSANDTTLAVALRTLPVTIAVTVDPGTDYLIAMHTMNVTIAEDWKKRLADQFEKPYFAELASFVRSAYLNQTIYPKPKDVFRAFDLTPFEKVRVVIVGQDPYHGPKQANGLCFAVHDDVAIPPSLRNIFKEIGNEFNVPPPANGDLSRWATQGVLLLNATLTVQASCAGSHQGKGWEEFTDAVLKKVSDEREHVVFLLWGAYARKKGAFIDRTKHLVLESAHPSPLSAHNGFFDNGHFKKANEYLLEHGQEPVDWVGQ